MKQLASEGIPVTLTCRVLKLCRAQYYRWLAQPVTESDKVREQRVAALLAAHADDPQAGYRYLRDEAEAAGVVMCERTAWRLCSQQQLWSSYGKKRGKNGKRPGAPVHDDHLAHTDAHGVTRHDFINAATGINQVWLTDITEHHTGEGKLYFCAIKDAFSNRIVGYAAGAHMSASLAVSALNTAVARRHIHGHSVAGCIVHSDRGSQFRSKHYLRALTSYHLTGSMGRVASAGDNAAMESFFSLLQRNVLNTKTWASREELTIAIITWIEHRYHRRRRQKRLDRLTPIEYETINTNIAIKAA